MQEAMTKNTRLRQQILELSAVLQANPDVFAVEVVAEAQGILKLRCVRFLIELVGSRKRQDIDFDGFVQRLAAAPFGELPAQEGTLAGR